MSARLDQKSPFADLVSGKLPALPRADTQMMIEIFPELRANGWAVYAGHCKNGTVRIFGVVRDQTLNLDTGTLLRDFLGSARAQLEAQGYAHIQVENRLFKDEQGRIPYERTADSRQQTVANAIAESES